MEKFGLMKITVVAESLPAFDIVHNGLKVPP